MATQSAISRIAITVEAAIMPPTRIVFLLGLMMLIRSADTSYSKSLNGFEGGMYGGSPEDGE